jgi:uncharacterized membrane protein
MVFLVAESVLIQLFAALVMVTVVVLLIIALIVETVMLVTPSVMIEVFAALIMVGAAVVAYIALVGAPISFDVFNGLCDDTLLGRCKCCVSSTRLIFLHG